MHRKQSLVLSGMLCAGLLLSACGSSSSAAEPVHIDQSELPYGATLSLNTQYGVPVQYDTRYLEDGLIEAIGHYYHAIEKNDAAEFSSVLFPLYHNYELNTVYEGQIDDAGIVSNSFYILQDYYGKEFDFALASVESIITADDVKPGRDALKNMLIDLAADEKVENFKEDFDALYELDLTLYLTDKGSGIQSETEFSIPNETLYGVHYQGQWYLIYVYSSGQEAS
ncbi:MAG: hypothetical protein IJ060_02460 [Oscillospiraceae bacterium]|nr:hypothetical protein [Oscillospiraceae bacterium]